jgi:hypothetical protein
VVRAGSRGPAEASAWPSPQVRGRRVTGPEIGIAIGSELRSVTNPTAPDHQTHILNRSREMQLMHEELARAHLALRHEEAIRRERRHRLVAAHRASRRAEEAALRAHRLLALATVW